ncbi:MAG TPA: AgmX/PglI C-terminal domain-containing protein, partial [Polyangia bacterium]|nr:AgmX/PglI C-terminal domain-containing protein [Polyangia bacterium]
VIDGEIAAFEGEWPTRLAGGSFRRQTADAGAPIVPWSSDRLSPGDLEERASIAERPIDGPTGTLPRRVVREALNRVTPRIRACYENTLKRHPRATASITVRLRVDSGGAVSVTSLAGAGSWPGLGECLGDALGAMSYPPPMGGPVDLIVPLRLVPEP